MGGDSYATVSNDSNKPVTTLTFDQIIEDAKRAGYSLAISKLESEKRVDSSRPEVYDESRPRENPKITFTRTLTSTREGK